MGGQPGQSPFDDPSSAVNLEPALLGRLADDIVYHAQGAGGAVNQPGRRSPDQLAEQRGSATMLILQQGASAMAQCMMVGVDDSFASMGLDESHPASASKPITIETQSSHGSGDDQFSTVIGRIDPSVTGVELILSDGQVIHTSAKHSWWGAWWPGRSVTG